MEPRKIESALISVYYKDGLAPIISLLKAQGVKIYSTGGTQKFIEEQGAEVTAVENLTDYPSIFGGRVKTLHPKVFGGILHRRDNSQDKTEVAEFDIPAIDLVIVDLYPFEETVAGGASEQEIIEKIDIGGISLIRAAAKNFKDVLCVASREQYAQLELLLNEKEGSTDLVDRKLFAAQAFDISSHYDSAIFNFFNAENSLPKLKISEREGRQLRYGENPHQQGYYFGNLHDIFEQLNGKELSYNNLVDVDAAVNLCEEFEDTAFVIVKHTNACGCALGSSVKEAYLRALASDPVSAFGGVLVTNKKVDMAAAEELHKLFFEILVAPDYDADALELLSQKKNRIILKQTQKLPAYKQVKSVLNGYLVQDKDSITDTSDKFTVATELAPTDVEKRAMVFAGILAKHTKSNTIVLATEDRLVASGVGQTSRVDALKQALVKAESFNLPLEGAVMASDAFFPFSDCVQIANEAGIKAVVQPGGSIRDTDSVDYCNANNMTMVLTGVRHFKH
jgi:phosphoribosylaminoimidazolecarboxamide formyltransferase/IMP cyclohydrolase